MSSALIVEINRRDVTVAEFLEAVQAMIGLTDSVASEMDVRGKGAPRAEAGSGS